jgi:hypothetical protein
MDDLSALMFYMVIHLQLTHFFVAFHTEDSESMESKLSVNTDEFIP